MDSPTLVITLAIYNFSTDELYQLIPQGAKN
jgi:hypothetical protein